MNLIKQSVLTFFLVLSIPGYTNTPVDNTQLAVWANEAIVATYTYSFDNFLARQKEIAKYFSAEGWTGYSAALNASKLPDAVQANKYYVSAVATLPPEIKALEPGKWEAKMPILVVYQNPQYRQKQDLDVTIQFKEASSGSGVRGFSIINLQAKAGKPPCVCTPESNAISEDVKKQ